jgi:nickel transport protein
MSGAFRIMRPAFVSLLPLAVMLTIVSPASAHRLIAEFSVLPDKKIQIESWFDSTGKPPRAATVEVFRADKQLLASGQLDAQGIFVFSFDRAEPLSVVVNAGGGHRAEVEIPEASLMQALAAESAHGNPTDDAASKAEPRADRSSRLTVKDIVIGVSFLLAAAAFLLSLRNARRLRELTRRRQ